MQGDVAEIWSRAREEIRAAVPASTFELWFEQLSAKGAGGGRLLLSTPDPGRLAWVERRYGALLSDAVRRQAPELEGVEIVAGGTPVSQGPARNSATSLNLDSRYTFDSFVIGPGNHFAHAAALAVAEVPAQAFNPLFLHGEPGLGKTHLMGAIADYVRSHSPHLTIEYLTAERFTTDFVASLQTRSVDAFKARFRGVDVLLVDDVQFLARKERTEEEFFHTFNALHAGGAQIVLSADRLPSEISDLARRLRERFEWGLVADVTAPDLATRLTILRARAASEGIAIDPGALEELARRVPTDVRRLEGSLTRIAAVASHSRRPINPALVAELIPLPGGDATASPVQRIQQATARVFGVPEEKMLGADRSKGPVSARQTAMYLTRELTDLSLPRIGRAFGDRDHATVHHAISRVRSRIADSPETAELVDGLLKELSAGEATPRPDRAC